MKAWRSRGFVQDSEDEDDTNADTQRSARHEDEPVRSINDAEKLLSTQFDGQSLGKEHDLSLQSRAGTIEGYADGEKLIAEDAQARRLLLTSTGEENATAGESDLRTRHHLEDYDGFIPLSSPLPDPATLIHGPRLESTMDPTTEDNTSNLRNPRTNVDSRSLWTAPERNFRQRKAIQLHPYQIMDGQYLKDMRDRGLRPTRVRQVSPLRQWNEQNGSGHSQSENDAQSTFESPQQRSARAQLREPVGNDASPIQPRVFHTQLHNSSHTSSETVQDDTLPSLDDILGGRTAKSAAHVAHKKRKLLHVNLPSTNRGVIPPLSDLPLEDCEVILSNFAEVETPLSSTSAGRASQELPQPVGRSGFRFPVGFSPQKPPTPATSSSATLVRHRRILDSANSSPIPQTSAQPVLYNLDSLSDSQDTQSSDNERSENAISPPRPEEGTGQLKVIQRRIKGVLPASWLKLDVKAQEKLPTRNSEQRRPQELRTTTQQPGIARRRLKPSVSGRSLREVLAISSDDEPEDEVPEGITAHPPSHFRQTTIMPHSGLPSLIPDDDPGERMEDNAVDLMLPPGSRRKQQRARQHRKRQTMLTHTFHQEYERQRLQSAMNSKGRSAAPTSSSVRSKPPRLSVLDVMPSSPEVIEQLPAFLKVARRQAKRYPNQARERPANKSIRLRTREDTQDAQSVLADWRSGKIKRKDNSASHLMSKRQPLAQRDPNILQSRLSFHAQGISSRQRSSDLQVKGMTDVMAKRLSLQNERPQKEKWQPRASRHVRTQPTSRFQNAQLEAEEAVVLPLLDRLQFQRQMYQQDLSFATTREPAFEPLPRTLSELEKHIEQRPSRRAGVSAVNESSGHVSLPQIQVKQRRPRKTKTHRIDVEVATYRQPEDYTLPVERTSTSVPTVDQSLEVLQNLNPWGVPYGRTFDILPLPPGTYFHVSTFVGSGDFKKAICYHESNQDEHFESQIVTIAGLRCRWGPWNEELCMDVHNIFEQAGRHLDLDPQLNSTAVHPQARSVALETSARPIEMILAANSAWLSFSDPIDRLACCSFYLTELEDLQALIEQRMILAHDNALRHLLRLLVRLIVLTSQMLTIAKHDIVPKEFRDRFENLIQRGAGAIFTYLLDRGFEDLRAFYDDNQRHVVRESGINGEQVAVEAVVVLIHTLGAISTPGLSFWNILNAKMLPSIDSTQQTGVIERTWLGIFTILPLFEIDLEGIHQSGRRFQIAFDNWDAVKRLLARVISLYQGSVLVPSTTVNDYVRILFLRCHDLIQAWAWRRSETVISVIFDFFAKREYMSLLKEDKISSSRFLEHLARSPALDATKDESAFHTFLKITAVGLQSMRKVYSATKIRSIVWRWIPNHSRRLDKDKELRQEDLDALRNQHDLLATLYWASPAGFRPRLDLIKNLVDHSTSHLEACRINMKTWANLVAFQLSTDEPVECLQHFAAWLKELLEQNVSLYRLARPELEAQYEAARNAGGAIIPANRLEVMISRNQRGIVAALSEALAGMSTSLKTAIGLPAAWTLLRDSNVQVAFSLLDAKSRKTIPVLIEIVNMFDTFLDLMDGQNPVAGSQGTNEESQDYGDWPEEDDDAMAVKAPLDQALDYLLDQSSSLLSNLFGSEFNPADELLAKMVEYWTRLAVTTIRKKRATYDNFLGEYGRHSWSQLRDTNQRRKYGPYFLSCLLNNDPSVVEQHREQFLSTWMCSLVEREAQLKYQHLLTTCLFNSCPTDPLLHNVPFTRTIAGEKYDISSTELRERRLALMSSILSNIRDEFQSIMQENPSLVRERRAEYTSLLNRVMVQMRRNYEDLRQGEVFAGTYVTFVHTMVEFMQQYTSDICPVDKYFTDSAAFPLPANDPTYLVGRLKSYDAKLDDTKMVKQLIMFMQNVSERAAVDNEQGYLMRQLTTALKCSYGHERIGSPLRLVLFRIIFPAYIEASLEGPSAWILARPLLRVCILFFRNVLFEFNAVDVSSVHAVTMVMLSIISAIMRAASTLEFTPQHFQQPYVLSTLSLMLEVTTECIPVLNYSWKRSGLGAAAIEAVKYLKDFSLFAAKHVLGRPDAFPPTNLCNQPTMDDMTIQMKTFCAQKLQEDLRDKWRETYGKHEVKRGTTWKELLVSFGSLDDEKAIFIGTIEAFHYAMDRASILS